MDADVLVIGAGVAGLNAARCLEAAGRSVLIVDAAEAIGGRVRTDLVDGFRLDRGFQLLNPAYPAVRAAVDLGRLGLRQFSRGIAVRTGDELHTLADPLRDPRSLPELLVALRADPGGAWALARWVTGAVRRGAGTGDDASLAASLDAAGVRGPLRDRVLEPFLAGVLADDTGATSVAFVRRLVHWFGLGTPGLPAQGMAALPALVRERVDGEVRTGIRVERLDRTGAGWTARTSDAALTASAVVVAAGPVAAAGLTGRPAPAMRGLVTWWFAPEAPPTRSSLLHLDGERRGPVVNTAVVSNVQPAYAPAGRHLVQASTLLGATAPTEAEVRTHLGRIYGVPADSWPVLAEHRIPDALPAVLPGGWRAEPTTEDGLVVAGDTADASLQGALASGSRAAAVLTGA
jgi:phytoene dehydrogenase-like protein